MMVTKEERITTRIRVTFTIYMGNVMRVRAIQGWNTCLQRL